MYTNEQDSIFFQEAVNCVSSSLDLSKAMAATYQFLSRHFPLDGLSYHTFDENNKRLHLLFLSTKTAFYYLDEFVYLPKEAVDRLRMQERDDKIVEIPHSFQRQTATLQSNAFSAQLPNRDRGCLVALLSTKNQIVGHLSLMGPAPECYSAEHKRKLTILRPALSLFMINLLHYHEITKLQERLAEQNRHLASEVRSLKQNEIVGRNGGLRHIFEMIDQLSGQDVPVLITGETGTGKELIADAIQHSSTRYNGPYVQVNCGAIPDSLIDSELFGHEKGAFTGATRSKPGRFEQAHGGTLFLDEIGDMPLNVQIRLLRVLQNGILQRVGGTQNIRVDTRIITATHRSLPNLIQRGLFREDLFYRLNVFPIHLPPLRERAQDIPSLVHFFISKKAKLLRLDPPPQLSSDSLTQLLEYNWPGNIRELENLIERALVIDCENPIQLHLHLPEQSEKPAASPSVYNGADKSAQNQGANQDEDTSKEKQPTSLYHLVNYARETFPSLDHVMADHIRLALQLCNGKIHGKNGAGELLGINSNTLRKRMDKLNISYGRKSDH
jgi:transcriptional regulator with GAF, ATPase, and Fis domain